MAALVVALGSALVAPRSASAEWRPSGALTGSLLVQSGGSDGHRPGYGGSLASDLWQTFGALRLGFYVGVHAVGGRPEQAMIFTPVAFSSAVVLDARKLSFEIRIRGGGFGGVVHESGFVGGLYLGSGAFLNFAISPRVSFGFGGDLHLLVPGRSGRNTDSRAYFAPGLTLVYRPEAQTNAP